MSKKIKVLVADDHTLVRKGICSLLEHIPEIETVYEARDETEAIIKAKTLCPNFILMDIAWFQHNGWEIDPHTQLRSLGSETHVLILNLHNTKERIRCAHRAKQLGSDGYLHKESNITELLMAMHTVQSGNLHFPTVSDGKTDRGTRQSAQENNVLTCRQKEVLRLLATGETLRSSAEILGISEKTIEIHRSNIARKLDLHTIAELTLFAVRNKIVSLD